MGTANTKCQDAEKVKKSKNKELSWETEGELKLKCRTPGKTELIRSQSSKNKNEIRNSFEKKKRDSIWAEDNASMRNEKSISVLPQSCMETKETGVEKKIGRELPSKESMHPTPPPPPPPPPPPSPISFPRALKNIRNVNFYKEKEKDNNIEQSPSNSIYRLNDGMPESSKSELKLSSNSYVESLFEQDILPELPNVRKKYKETKDVDVKAQVKSLEDLSDRMRSNSQCLLALCKQSSCSSDISSTYSKEDLNSVEVLWSGSKRFSIESQSENTFTTSEHSFASARRTFEEISNYKGNTNEETFRQLEDLGLGFVQDGKWIPTDVISRTIWNGVVKSKGCSAEWNHQHSKTFKDPNLLRDPQ